MMNSNWEANTMGYTTVEMLLEDVSNQMASSNLSRYSRGSGGQRTTGSMRVVKPNTTSNSPRSSMGLGRRRTVMTDGAYRRRLAMMEQSAMAPAGFNSNDGLQMAPRTGRPVSWHPASQQPAQAMYQATYPTPTANLNNQFQMFDLPPTPVVYSGYTSPASTFSPLSGPYTAYEQPQYLQERSVSYPSNPNFSINQPLSMEEQTQTFTTTANMDPTLFSHFDWSNFATNGFEDSTTAPPTPKNFLPIQHPEPNFPTEDSIPYHNLSDPESDGEELIGMGLYDPPEISKVPSDPQLDNYRALMMSQLLGTAYRRPETPGKGLKLEETWNPPASDDGEEDDDSEQDGEGEEEEQSASESVVNTVEQTIGAITSKNDTNVNHLAIGSAIPSSHNYDPQGWL